MHIVVGALKWHVEQFPTQKEAAKSLGVSPQYLSDVLQGRREITEKLAEKVGWRLEKTWKPAAGE